MHLDPSPARGGFSGLCGGALHARTDEMVQDLGGRTRSGEAKADLGLQPFKGVLEDVSQPGLAAERLDVGPRWGG